ncbi:hypothetical protein PV04_10952 [Phialophora macrospora]|uniref:Protein kinase domain-containing protein n=1 Tax=Phialophora macrospora TaxID=1851006 RepID=A0A0D2DK75_9EURO|nr:hypothetical protein PV04_10952 [Phialophora macrospora]
MSLSSTAQEQEPEPEGAPSQTAKTRETDTPFWHYRAAPSSAPISFDGPEALVFALTFERNNTVDKREDTATIGTGSFASVVKAKELRSQEIFAAKVLRLKGPRIRRAEVESVGRAFD